MHQVISKNNKKIILTSQTTDWDKYITDQFKKDLWYLPSMFEKYPNISKKNMKFDFITNPYIKAEAKYFFMYKILAKEYSPHSLALGFCQSLRHLWNFIEKYKFNINSILDLNYDKTLILLRTHLLEIGYSKHDRAPTLFKSMYSFFSKWYDTRVEYEKDIWDLRRLYPESEIPIYVGNRAWYMNFTIIKDENLKTLIKRFYKVRVATRALQTVHKEMRYLRHFIVFLQEKYPTITSFSKLTRIHMEEFYIWLSIQKNQYGELTSLREKRYTVQYLRLVFEYLQRTGDKDAPLIPLVYPEDECGTIKRIPKFIPDDVFNQLISNLNQLSTNIKNAVIIVMNVGMRASELLTLRENCISYDNDGTPWITYYMSKMHKEHRVPTNIDVTAAIESQRELAGEVSDPKNNKYLFRTPKGILQYQRITSKVHKLARKVPITDSTGNVYLINFHQFRHTVGTNMINSGVPITSVQKYLGHESPEMTMVYAHIHDSTLKADFEKLIKHKLYGNYTSCNEPTGIDSIVNTDMEWFKHNLYKNALPNGYCLHHPKQGNCPHANICLTCPKFITTKHHIPILSQQLSMVEKLVADAKNRGWEREVEHQSNIATSIKKLLSVLNK
ncbi:tyrosine-type recombinase/integrase [Clostridium lacusfryxellense]|uniref:tyrosine-type recombinase/integrase n=1 Tax=Clostridium lacusfryxellense TaxID=205328 RepID=UPI001C0DFAC8|nr:tyrosine-type recombinase/integrase [Clostridium lacusfryxellense]MBU3114804.1 site-specific integrase [Clostridium lacusfryxellense]